MPIPRAIFSRKVVLATSGIAFGSTSYLYLQNKRASSIPEPQLPSDSEALSLYNSARSAINSSSSVFPTFLLESGKSSNDDINKRPPLLWTPPSRSQMIEALKKSKIFPRSDEYGDWDKGTKKDEEEGYDLLIIGGGATGAGTALDAASRGLKVAMVERDDFSSGTSSKSTKLVHGGVRYLQKAVFELDYEQYKLVREALHERKTFLHIAPYLSHQLPIMLPLYKWWQAPYYWVGCKMYDFLAGAENMQPSYFLTKSRTLETFPMLKKESLVGSIVYSDGQHNDSRMNMALALTAVHHGAVAVNHCEVVELLKKEDGKLCGARVKDVFTGDEWNVKAKGIINATGPFSDGIRKLDDPSVKEIVAPASGVHITFPNYYSPRKMGLLDPATSDGRVIFFLPWLGNTIAGTTDTLCEVTQHPVPQEEEISWILSEVRNYLSPEVKVRRGDVLSAWAGIRPLVRDPAAADTQSLVRNHMINVASSGLLTIAGGKWTTYRAMAQETVDAAIKAFDLKPIRKCATESIQLIGSHGWDDLMFIKLIQQFGLETEVAKHLADTYGDRAWAVCSMSVPTGKRWPVHGNRIDDNYPFIEEEITYAIRNEFASTAADIIARRTRLAFLNAQAALDSLPKVIDIMAKELGWDKNRQTKEFEEAKLYLVSMGLPSRVLKDLTLKDVKDKKYIHADDITNRNVFTPEELDNLIGKFSQMDFDQDGKLSVKDLNETMKFLGYDSVAPETLKDIIREVDSNADGMIELKEFLDIAAGAKEVHLKTALTTIIDRTPPSPKRRALGISEHSSIEKSGGGV